MNGSNDARPESEEEYTRPCTCCRQSVDYADLTIVGKLWLCVACLPEVSQ